MKNVMLKIKGKQSPRANEEDTIELITEGKYYDKGNSKYLVYQESELSGMEGCTTTLKISDDKIVMKRYGNATSELIFEKGKRYISTYSTPFGNFKIEILTKEIECSIDENIKGNISLSYNISLQGLAEGTNKLDIEIM
ncbi:MAG: hypothetical protein PWQ37_531 [Candidatus Petromonas sp.]|jgi:uncharacterized beta-barrel protein YwiB (DUF1934 family)|nr:hypothetical protein [Candidatus Petromonas sp.]